MLNGKATIVLLTVGLIKKTVYFSKLKSSGGRVKVELDLSNYATKAFKNCNRCWYIKIC